MSRQDKIPVEITKITNPDGSSRTGAITYLEEVMSTPDIKNRLLTIEKEYALLVQRCLRTLKRIRTPEGRSDAQLRWKLADAIFIFLNSNANKIGVIFVNYKNALSADLGVSKSELSYLLKFRSKYASLSELNDRINWSKYRELMDFTNDQLRKKCETLIKRGEITKDSEIRKFKKPRVNQILKYS